MKLIPFSLFRRNSKMRAGLPLRESDLGFKARQAGLPLIGLIAGNGSFPRRFCANAFNAGFGVFSVNHILETSEEVDKYCVDSVWVKVGQLGTIIDSFKKAGVKQVALAGGINRVRLFGGVKLDARGLALISRLRSVRDDVVMRGIAEELEKEGIEVIECTRFLQDCLVSNSLYTKTQPTESEKADIEIGISTLKALSSLDVGQLVVVKDGLVVAIEAVEGSDKTILRAGQLAGAGSVVVKCAKVTQDMRFDVPTVGIRTIESMIRARSRVLALEIGRTLIVDREDVLSLADKNGISIVCCPTLV